MAKGPQRAFALIAAVLFLLSSVAFSIAVIVQLNDDNKNEESAQTAEDLQKQLQEAQNQQQEQPEEEPVEGALKGTKLQNFTPMAEVETLQVVDLVEGTGAVVAEGATVTAHYTGAYAVNGEIFESSKDSGQPATFPLGQVIAGWQQGVPGMKVGGTRRLIIPGALAYGVAPEGYKPGDGGRPLGTLIFDIELTAVE